MTAMMLKNTLLIGVKPPVLTLTLLLPYPPKAGSAMKHPPTTFATPSATSSLFGLNVTFLSPLSSFPLPALKLFAATLLSKKPSRAIRNAVLNASAVFVKLPQSNGKSNLNGVPFALIEPMISSPWLAQSNFHAKTALRTTTRNRSGTYATH